MSPDSLFLNINCPFLFVSINPHTHIQHYSSSSLLIPLSFFRLSNLNVLFPPGVLPLVRTCCSYQALNLLPLHLCTHLLQSDLTISSVLKIGCAVQLLVYQLIFPMTYFYLGERVHGKIFITVTRFMRLTIAGYQKMIFIYPAPCLWNQDEEIKCTVPALATVLAFFTSPSSKFPVRRLSL